MEFTDWYKKLIEDSQVEPPDSIWSSISDELDINESWHVIDRRLSWNRFFQIGKKVALYSTAAVILVFIGFKLFLNPNSPDRNAKMLTNYSLSNSNYNNNFANITKEFYLNTKENDALLKPFVNTENPILSNRELDKIKQLERENIGFFIPIPEMEQILNAESFLTSENIEFNGKSTVNDKPHDSIILDQLPRLAVKVTSKNKEGDKTIFLYHKKYLLVPKGLSFGTILSYNNAWLLNQETYKGLDKNELNTTVPFYDLSYGIVAGWNISDKIGIELRSHFSYNSGQKYNEYRQGKYVQRSIDINYYSNTVLMCYKQAFYLTPKILTSRNYLIGLNYYSLRKAGQVVNGKSEDISGLYNNRNFSVDLGYQYDMYLFDNFILSTGINVNYGLINIWKGNDKIPSNFNDTRTGSIGFFISAKYFIPFTIK